MNNYVSISRNMRGFYYQSDWTTIADFWKAMKYQRDHENNEIEWAFLFSKEGNFKEEYRRGMPIEIGLI